MAAPSLAPWCTEKSSFSLMSLTSHLMMASCSRSTPGRAHDEHGVNGRAHDEHGVNRSLGQWVPGSNGGHSRPHGKRSVTAPSSVEATFPSRKPDAGDVWSTRKVSLTGGSFTLAPMHATIGARLVAVLGDEERCDEIWYCK